MCDVFRYLAERHRLRRIAYDFADSGTGIGNVDPAVTSGRDIDWIGERLFRGDRRHDAVADAADAAISRVGDDDRPVGFDRDPARRVEKRLGRVAVAIAAAGARDPRDAPVGCHTVDLIGTGVDNHDRPGRLIER
jgi:hypothetical protein